ncbi:zinc finger protein 182 isoform X3 [Monomorium pharaonis]|uniref:zinc finger protein 182 isoform X3 n=1 Tax=Monomorium pharaonis TaxID=307658 RepID=UPI00063F6A94|nr:zinc finger protein 182 isoform X3 [Monomorium pharaonis]
MQNNIEDLFNGNKVGDKDIQPMDHISAMNGSNLSTPSVTHENSQTNVKTYRLIIQIDKIRGKPGPKCKKCHKIFEMKEGVKQHCLVEHPKIALQNTTIQVSPSLTKIAPKQNDNYFCINCNIGFTSDQAYRTHINSHGKKEGFTCNITNEASNIIAVPNPLTGNQIGILQPVKFSCRVCSKQFDNFDEVNLHTRTHLQESGEELKCNICKKSFKNNAEFSEHLKHHLSRAHPCPICSKAFINKTTLNTHLKTHSASVK